MMKLFALVPIALLLVSAAYADIYAKISEQEKSENEKETITIPMPPAETSKWHHAFSEMKENGSFTLDWVPPNETIKNWTQILEIQFIPNPEQKKVTAPEFVSSSLAALKDKFQDIQADIISKSEDIVIYEWSHPASELSYHAKYEIAKIIARDNGIYRIAFTIKTEKLSQNQREEWLQYLTQTKISS